jgi:chromosome segregation ATPase
MRSLNFEEAEQDFYDMKKSYGMQQAEIKSLQNIKEQIMFDEQDIDDMINYQREMIRDLQSKLMDKEEELRVLVTSEVKDGL